MKKILLIIPLCGIFLLVYTCKKDKKKATPVNTKNGFTIMTNGADPLIVTYVDKAGNAIDFFGTRDAQGKPLKINEFAVRKGKDTTLFQLDDLYRPVNVITPKKTQLQFTWISAKQAAVTVLSNNGVDQLNTNIDFGKAVSAAPVRDNKKHQLRTGTLSKMVFTPHNALQNNSLKTNASGTGDVLVNVTSCGLPTEGTVTVHVQTHEAVDLGYFPASPIGNGTYIAHVPTDLAPKLNIGSVCSTVATVLGLYCSANDGLPGLPVYLCVGLTGAAASTGIGALFAAEIAEACAYTTAGLEVYCNTVGKEYGPGGPSVADELCEADVLDREIKQDVVMYATVAGIPYDSFSSFKTVSGDGPFPTFNVENSTTTIIRTLTLNPPSPTQGQSYVGTADIYCLQVGSTITMSIVGTDGYTNSQTTDITNTQQNGTYTLYVPGAQSGVMDIVTVLITKPDGSTLKKTAQLVFN